MRSWFVQIQLNRGPAGVSVRLWSQHRFTEVSHYAAATALTLPLVIHFRQIRPNLKCQHPPPALIFYFTSCQSGTFSLKKEEKKKKKHGINIKSIFNKRRGGGAGGRGERNKGATHHRKLE